MQRPLTFNLEFTHRPYFRTMAMINKRTEDALDAETLEVLKYQFTHMYEHNKDRIADKVWKKNDMLLSLFDHIVSQFNRQPMREGYNLCVTNSDLDDHDHTCHSWPWQARFVPMEHQNLFLPLNWILKQQKNVSLFDSLVMAFHHLYKVIGIVDHNDWNLESMWDMIQCDDFTLFNGKNEVNMPKELYKRTEYWYKSNKDHEFLKCRAGEFLYNIQNSPSKLFKNPENKDMDYIKVQHRLKNKIDKIDSRHLKKVVRDLIELLDVCRYGLTIDDYSHILDFDISNGIPNLAINLTQIVFDPYDLFGMHMLHEIDQINGSIGSVGFAYASNLFYPKPDEYFDSGFLEEFIEKTQKLQLSLYELYKYEIYQHDECAQWF